MSDPLILFLIGFFIALMSVIVGSSTPIFLALLQVFFPHLSLGELIGSFKMGSNANAVGALIGFWRDIDWRFVLKNGPLYVMSAFVGANIVAELPVFWILPLLIIAFVIAESASLIKRFVNQKSFYFLEVIYGIYTGLIGASSKIMLLSLFRIKVNDDSQIGYLKIQIQTIAFFSSLAAVIAHYFHGNLIWAIIAPLIVGSILGGVIAGKFLVKMEKFPPHMQKIIMRASFIIGILTSAWMIYGQ